MGEILQREDLVFKRPGDGIQISDINRVIGRRVTKDISEDVVINPSDFEI